MRWDEPEARWVGAQSVSGYVYHATWVLKNTEEEEVRDGFAKCGAKVKISGIGPYHGRDWDRLPTRDCCLNCLREMTRGDAYA